MSAVEAGLWLLAAAFGLLTSLLVTGVLALRPLPRLAALPAGPDEPRARVSVVVAARNEAARIATTAERLLAQRGIELELLVVDDRSEDATPGILAELAAGDARLRLLRVDRLPEGWLGKTHACQLAARRATGEWLLFTDGDAWIEPDTVARAVAAARRDGADHVCLIPRDRAGGLLGEAAVAAFFLGFLPAGLLVNRDLWRGPMGIGAFNLVRASAWRAIGGHEPLRLEVIDDAKLGLLLQREGFRTRVLTAFEEIEVAWATSLRGIARALEKNAFALVNYSGPLAAATVVAPLGVWLAALLAPFTGTAAGGAAATGLLSLAAPCLMLARRARWRPASALLVPFVLPVLPLILARSAWIALRRGGIRWRETFYPLELLRRGLVR